MAHLRLARQVDPEPFRRAINDRLPPDVHILSLAAAADRFHSRHDAVSRSYLYQISRRRTALAKRFVWWVKRPLDEGRMAEAAALAEGKHDFRLFCERPAEQTSTLVVVEKIEVTTAGALILVASPPRTFSGRWSAGWSGRSCSSAPGSSTGGSSKPWPAAKVPKSGKGLPAEWTAPPSGLFLERVLYEGDPPLGAIAPTVPVAAE